MGMMDDLFGDDEEISLAQWHARLDVMKDIERNKPMFDHTYTLTFRSRRADPHFPLHTWASDLASDAVTVTKVSSVPVLNPNAHISNERLRAYHARMRAEGFTSDKARHAYRDAIVGRKVGVASTLTNAEFDKLMAALDDAR
jgi:hypothetical protein